MLQQDHPDDYVVATGETHPVREFCELAFGHLDLDWEQYVKVDERFYRPAEVDLLVGTPDEGQEGARLGAQDVVPRAGADDGRRRHGPALGQARLDQLTPHRPTPRCGPARTPTAQRRQDCRTARVSSSRVKLSSRGSVAPSQHGENTRSDCSSTQLTRAAREVDGGRRGVRR